MCAGYTGRRGFPEALLPRGPALLFWMRVPVELLLLKQRTSSLSALPPPREPEAAV